MIIMNKIDKKNKSFIIYFKLRLGNCREFCFLNGIREDKDKNKNKNSGLSSLNRSYDHKNDF